MSDFFCENIGMELRIEQKAPDELVGKRLVQDYGGFEKGTKITEQNGERVLMIPPDAGYGAVVEPLSRVGV